MAQVISGSVRVQTQPVGWKIPIPDEPKENKLNLWKRMWEVLGLYVREYPGCTNSNDPVHPGWQHQWDMLTQDFSAEASWDPQGGLEGIERGAEVQGGMCGIPGHMQGLVSVEELWLANNEGLRRNYL